jgi:subfamily B ATP-binding cassette protein MsbA
VRRGFGTSTLVTDLARPYRGWPLMILAAMFAETLAALAGPWPLKIVIDYAVGHRPMPTWAVSLLGSATTSYPKTLAAVAAAGLVVLAILGGIASYVDNYYTESFAQWVGNDLRLRIYEHLESLSFGYYDTHETGALLSTMTDDVSTVQDFVSSFALGIWSISRRSSACSA